MKSTCSLDNFACMIDSFDAVGLGFVSLGVVGFAVGTAYLIAGVLADGS
ncbi:MAG: hypothetical protein AAFQ32_04670 [Pseudomonadota bacterium]